MQSPPKNRRSELWLRLGLAGGIMVGVVLAYQFLWRGGRDRLVVYCAHDAVYSERLVADFEKRTGIPVSLVPDTEATKSLGLVERLIREKDAPRCDVFWNNQLLGTMQLQQEGILLPYRGPGFERIPAAFKDADGHWVGFGARLRVYIVNTEKLSPEPPAIARALEGDMSGVAIAKPLYGTTLTHYSALWHMWGGPKLKEWHADWRRRGVREVMGNAQVKGLVAQGVCSLGLTDTDDFFLAKDEGAPVEMLPIRLEGGSVICIPNTVSIIRGTKRLEAARKLVDYLLSEECELALASSKSRQIPLGPVPEEGLSEEVRALKRRLDNVYPLAAAFEARTECLRWLKSEYAR